VTAQMQTNLEATGKREAPKIEQTLELLPSRFNDNKKPKALSKQNAAHRQSSARHRRQLDRGEDTRICWPHRSRRPRPKQSCRVPQRGAHLCHPSPPPVRNVCSPFARSLRDRERTF
jgi:hypothetical protein